MDIALQYIQKAKIISENYVDMTLSEFMFEASDATLQKNAKVEEASTSMLKKAIKKIRELITSISESVRDFFNRIFMSKAEREKFNEYKKKIEANPEIKNKKIRVTDFRKMNAAYDKALADINTSMKNGDDPESKMKSILGTLDGALKAASIVTVPLAALKLIDITKDSAKTIQSQLDKNDALCNTIEKILGTKEYGKFKKKVDKASRDSIWVRFNTQILHRQAKSNETGVINTLKLIGGLVSANKKGNKAEAAKIAGTLLQNPKIASTAGKGLQLYGSALSRVEKIKSNFNKAEKSMKNNK